MDEQHLQQQIQHFIRQFGLLEQEHTPCHVPLSPSQAHALQVLGQYEQLTQHHLAQHLHLEKSTVSRLVNTLTERNWVTRTTNTQNRREILLSLTEHGQKLYHEILVRSRERYEALWQRIPTAKRESIVDALTTLNTLLREEQEDADRETR